MGVGLVKGSDGKWIPADEKIAGGPSVGIPEEEATHYEKEVKAGQVVVTVNAGDRSVEAESILNQYGRTRYERF